MASLLIFPLLAGAVLCPAAERLKVQVVQTHTGVKLGGAGSVVDPDGTDPSLIRCNGDSGTDAKDPGSACVHPPVPATPALGRGDYSLFFDVIVVMPDSTRVVFHCSTILDAGCEGFPVYPQSTSVVCRDFQFDGTSYKDCTASGSSSAGIGTYEASLRGDRMTIFGPNWVRHYRRKGTWDYPATSAQDPKPAAPQVIKVSAVQDSIHDPNPPTTPEATVPASADAGAASPQDPKPAMPQEATSSVQRDIQAAEPQDPKPAPPQQTTPPATQDPKPPETQETKPALPGESPAPQDPPAPATQQETKPALPQETAIPAPQETKPVPPPETKPAGDVAGPEAQHASAAGTAPPGPVDQQVDPNVIEQAKAGNMVAQYKLGYDYYRGRGVALDYVQAAIWWRKAADQGYPSAQNNLGVLYNAGKGVPQSYAEAYFWENLAAAGASGILQAQFAKNRDESAARLWFYERSKVQRRAAKWAAAHPVPPRSQEPKNGGKVSQ